MKQNLLLTTATVLMLGTGMAMAQNPAGPPTGDPAAQPGSATQNSVQQQQQNPAAAPNAVGDRTPMGDAASLDKLMGKDVYGADGKKLGSIEDIILDPQTGKAQLAVVQHGGVLGIGGKEIGIDFALLGMEGDRIVAKQVTEAQAQAMPEFKYADNAVSYNRDRSRNADRNQNPNREDPNARPATTPKQ
ncbi:MAG TPA: PRC-barrel domain-containing protein [Azospirillum sp.]|nr:PRC-barrel domain-containing protein [Azospirillum sp.]